MSTSTVTGCGGQPDGAMARGLLPRGFLSWLSELERDEEKSARFSARISL
ncbi:hypothetical protein I6F11_01310 [Ensifer sp. NBAIM29]|nr:hypothetical protein [Ensifer sp. NBAIM29]